MVVLRVEHRCNPMNGVYAETMDILWEHHTSGNGWSDLPNIYSESRGMACAKHVCACRSLSEFYEWWPKPVLRNLIGCEVLHIVVLLVRTDYGAHFDGSHQAVIKRSSCEVLTAFSINKFLSLSESEKEALFTSGGHHAIEQERAASTAYDYREEPRVDSQRFARESRRVAAKMREHVQAQYTCKVPEYGGGGLTFPKGV